MVVVIRCCFSSFWNITDPERTREKRTWPLTRRRTGWESLPAWGRKTLRAMEGDGNGKSRRACRMCKIKKIDF